MPRQDTNRHKTTQAETNLQQAADIEQASGWTVARLIASSVNGSASRGRPTKNRSGSELRLTIDAATKIMRKSHDTIRAYLKAWDAAAADGHCTPSADLTPDVGWSADLPPAELWEQYRNPNSHSTKPKAETIPSDPVEAARSASGRMSSDQRREWLSSEIKTNADAQWTARRALDDVYSEAPKPVPHREQPTVDAATDLVFEFRQLHKGVDRIVQLVNEGTAKITNRDAVLNEIAWLRTALGYIEDGVKSDNLAAEVAEFLEAQA